MVYGSKLKGERTIKTAVTELPSKPKGRKVHALVVVRDTEHINGLFAQAGAIIAAGKKRATRKAKAKAR